MRPVFVSALAIVLAFPPRTSLSDAPAPLDWTYGAVVDGHRVIICPTALHAGYYGDLSSVCLESNAMVRVNVDTGETHALTACSDPDGTVVPADSGAGCVVDECVAEGRYRYGLVPALGCPRDQMAQTTNYVTVEVTGELGVCQLSEGNLGRQPFGDDPGWDEQPSTTWCSGSSPGADVADEEADLGDVDVDVADAGAPGDESCGCSQLDATAQVLLVNGGAVLLGLLILAARRRRDVGG